MNNKTLTIKIKKPALCKGIQKLALRHGFKWKNGICKVVDCGENPCFLQINFPAGTLEYFAEFNYDGEYIQFKDSYEIENEFDQPAEVIALKNAFIRYARRLEVHQGPKPETKPKVKYGTWKKEKGVPIQHFHNIMNCVDDI